ncbi:MAG: triphosphoribosyl-dephospho-CoA synthase, partial [Spirochaetaceae bacterium]|nr:triphosphoribosyl-dephospho-CoA synthase [Spirochaetaceae bacterium]
GIRAEAEAGFPSVLRRSLPRVEADLAAGHNLNDALVNALLELFSDVEDTNVLSRGGSEGLALLRSEASTALSLGGMSSDAGRKAIVAMGELLKAMNLSPGGCADLLAVTAFLRKLDSLGRDGVVRAGADRAL